jgi:RNA recognition motif-containing protein
MSAGVEQGGDDAAAAAGEGTLDGDDHVAVRSSRQRQQAQNTLFVGDLPPVGFSSTDLQGLFAAYGWNVVSARVMGSQCYGFVEFGSAVEAEQALQLVQDRDPGFYLSGGFIRASWAQGSMPRWKQGKAVLSRLEQGQGLEGLEAYEHPTARLARLQSAAAVAAVGARRRAAAVLPPHQQQMGSEPQSGRPVIDYSDL